MWADEQKFAPGPEVVSRVIDGEAVLLDLASQCYFGLNAVGTRVWEHLSAGKSVAEIRAALLAEFDVTEDVLAGDLGRILDELSTKGLVRKV